MNQLLQTHYADFYAKGGWTYYPEKERQFLQERIIAPLGITKDMRIMDLGCGLGLHTSLFHELGYDVVGVDMSEVGITTARERYPGVAYINSDADGLADHFAPASFDVIFIRGMSWYHYELDTVNKLGVDVPAKTKQLFAYLKPGGIFILQIKTDFSGNRPKSGVYHLKVSEFKAAFEPFGERILMTDWDGVPLNTDEDGYKSGNKVIIATRAPA